MKTILLVSQALELKKRIQEIRERMFSLIKIMVLNHVLTVCV